MTIPLPYFKMSMFFFMDTIFGIKMNKVCEQQQTIKSIENSWASWFFTTNFLRTLACYNVKLKQPPILFIVPNLVCKTFILIIVKSTNATESINFSNLLLKKKTCRTLAMKFRKKNLNLYRLSFRFHIVQICKTYAKHTLTIFLEPYWIQDDE